MCTTHTPQSVEVKVRSGEREIACMSEVYYEWLGMNYMMNISLLSLTTTVTIKVGYNPVFYTTTEGQGFVVLNITIFDPPAGGTPRPFTLVINTQDDTASMFSKLHIKCTFNTNNYRGRTS